jgi:hypothetical protein
MGRKLIGFSPRAHGKERQSKLVVARSSQLEAHRVCQRASCWPGTSCMPSTSRQLIRQVASRDRTALRSDPVRRIVLWADGMNFGVEGLPSTSDWRICQPCSTLQQFEHSIFSTPSCRQAVSTQIVGPELHCLKITYVYLMVTCFIFLCQPDSTSTWQTKDQQMHYSIHLGTRNLQVKQGGQLVRELR